MREIKDNNNNNKNNETIDWSSPNTLKDIPSPNMTRSFLSIGQDIPAPTVKKNWDPT